MNAAECLREVGLHHVASRYKELAQKAVTEKISSEEFIVKLLGEEKRERARRREEVLLKLSNFPVIKTFSGFDFSFNPSIDKKVIEELRTLRFIEERANLLFLGPPGVGKTHLAMALGVEPIKKGYVTYVTTVDEIARKLFQVISTRYEKGSIIMTSNKSIVEWGDYLADSVLASALLDLPLHHSYVINIKGKSYRLKDKQRSGGKEH